MSPASHFLGLLLLAACALAQQPTAQRPVWPQKFDVAFGLGVEGNITGGNLPTVNASAHFWYDYSVASQRITYQSTCLPGLLPANLAFNGCDLLFIPNGTYLISQKLGVCCLLFPGVGTVPPNFLDGFNASQFVMPATDFYGVPHASNFWTTDVGFYYWTDVHTGQDISFVDGGFILWSFVPSFSFAAQDKTLYTLPSQSCSKQCSAMADSRAIVVDPLTRLAHHVNGVPLPKNVVSN